MGTVQPDNLAGPLKRQWRRSPLAWYLLPLCRVSEPINFLVRPVISSKATSLGVSSSFDEFGGYLRVDEYACFSAGIPRVRGG